MHKAGNRFKGGIEDGAMPPSHRYFGNPMLSAAGRILFRCPQFGDFYYGLRGSSKEAVQKTPHTEHRYGIRIGDDCKIRINGLEIAEVPTTLSKGREGSSAANASLRNSSN